MNISKNPALVDKLAAEYVLGTLKGGARRRFETWLAQNAAMRRSVAEWQDRLLPLGQFAPAAQPPAHLWRNLERRLGLAPAPWWQSWWNGLNFWRSLGLGSSVLAGVLITFLVLRPDAPQAAYVARLENAQAQTIALVSGDVKRRELTVRMINPPQLTQEQALELWAVPKQGKPRSLGLVALQKDGSLKLPLPEQMTPQAVPLLAISLEPRGGSKNPDGPSGPILFKGEWLQL